MNLFIILSVLALSVYAQKCPDGQDYERAKASCKTNFNPEDCSCNPDISQPVACPRDSQYAGLTVEQARKQCASQAGQLDEKCFCLITACRPTAEAVKACEDKGGMLNNKCECVVPQGDVCPRDSQYAGVPVADAKSKCAGEGGNLDEKCNCIKTACKPTADAVKACEDEGGMLDSNCRCVVPQQGDVCPRDSQYAGVPYSDAKAKCSNEGGQLDEKCNCIKTACKPTLEAVKDCEAKGGMLNNRCECVVPQGDVCPKDSQYAGVPVSDAKSKCAGEGGELDAKCFCVITACRPTAEAVKDCENKGGMLNNKCECVVPQGDVCPRDSQYAGVPYSDAKAKCQNEGGNLDEKCNCIKTACKPSLEAVKDCEAKGGQLNSKCECVVPQGDVCPRDSQYAGVPYSDAKAKCQNEGGNLDEKCNCIKTACKPSLEAVKDCEAKEGQLNSKCECVVPQGDVCPRDSEYAGVPYSDAKAKCASTGGQLDEKCNCNRPADDCSDKEYSIKKQECEKLNQANNDAIRYVANRKTCECDAVCYNGVPIEEQQKICRARGLEFLKEKCACGSPIDKPVEPCDGHVSKCPPDHTWNKEKCFCQRLCKDGQTYSNAKDSCYKSGGSFIPDTCECRTCDEDFIKACEAKNGVVDTATCSCQPKRDCSLVKIYCPNGKIDPDTCRCVDEKPCQVNADFADILQKKCDGNNRFFEDTCACEPVCPEGSDFEGQRLTVARKTCYAKGGKFNVEKCGCVFVKPVECDVAAPCSPGQSFDKATCKCVDVCPDGRFYAAAKEACREGNWSPVNCACVTDKCSDDEAKKWKLVCEAEGLTLRDDGCGCEKSETKCDQLATLFADQIKICLSKEGYVFNKETCECEQIVVPPQLCEDGTPIDEAHKKCEANNGSFDRASCRCKQRCLAKDTAFKLAKCRDDQRPDGCGGCIDACVSGSKLYDVAKLKCYESKGVFVPSTCECTRSCDVPAEKVKECHNTDDMRWDYNACDCVKTVFDKCDLSKEKCVEKKWLFNADKCTCVAPRQISIKFNADIDEATIEATKTRIAAVLKTCDIDFEAAAKSDGKETKAVVTIGSIGDKAGACVVELETVKKTLESYSELADVQITDNIVADEEPIQEVVGASSGSTIVVATVALMASVVAQF